MNMDNTVFNPLNCFPVFYSLQPLQEEYFSRTCTLFLEFSFMLLLTVIQNQTVSLKKPFYILQNSYVTKFCIYFIQFWNLTRIRYKLRLQSPNNFLKLLFYQLTAIVTLNRRISEACKDLHFICSNCNRN